MTNSSRTFDNGYFKDLLAGGGAFASDRALLLRTETRDIVLAYSIDQTKFFADYKSAHEKMNLMGA